MTVSLSQLRQVLDRLLVELAEGHGGDQVDLTADYYWVIDPHAAYDPTAPPAGDRLTLGQLSDDVAELAETAAASSPRPVWHDLAHVVGILQRLAAQDRP